MKAVSLFCLLLLILSSVHGAEPPALLTLTSTDGKTFEGTVVSLGKDSVKVKRKDGKTFDVPLNRLTPETIEAVQKAAAPKPPAEKKNPASGGRKAEPVDPKKPEDIEIKVVVKQGAKVSATLELKDGVVSKATVVENADDKTPHFEVDFSKDADRTAATVEHTFPGKVLRVRCLARAPGRKNYVETSILPLQPGLPCYESWAGKIEELVFFDFRFEDARAAEKDAGQDKNQDDDGN